MKAKMFNRASFFIGGFMSRERSLNRDKAYEIFKEYGGKISSKEIATQLGENESTVASWRKIDKWAQKIKHRGAPFGNKRAVGNHGGAPEKNANNYKHGFYSKYLPKQTYDIFEKIEEMDPIEILWQNIKIKFAAIIRSQKIMYVTAKKEMVKELKKIKTGSELTGPKDDKQAIETYREEEYEFQFAWDRQATFLKAQSDAMRTLTKMIRDYDELVNKSPMATEEQKLRIEKLKVEVKNATGGEDESSKEGINEFIKATSMSQDEIKAMFEGEEYGEEKETD